jgi:hypothetical protein
MIENPRTGEETEFEIRSPEFCFSLSAGPTAQEVLPT